LHNENFSQLEMKCYSSDMRAEIIKTPVPVRNTLILQAMDSANAYRSAENEHSKALEDACIVIDQPARAIAVVMLSLDNLPIGVLWAARFEHRLYSEMDLILLESLADQVDIAIKHGVMTSQLQTLSTIEERGRIAREMHDSLAQILGYLNLQVQTLELMHQQSNWGALRDELGKMRLAVQAAHADVRENILSLRTTLSSEKGLVVAIEEYLEEFGYQTGVKTRFTSKVNEDLSLSPMAEVQLVCILQEALTNVRKHARARHVNITITQAESSDDRYVELTIEDDGVGFVPIGQKRHFGLVTMLERAHSVGGKFNVSSAPEQGTLITCELPCMRQENMIRQDLRFKVS